MSWRDREYSDESYGEPVGTSSGLRRPPRVTLALMIVHGAAFVLVAMLHAGRDAAAILPMITLQGEAAHPLAIALHPFSTSNLLSAVFTVLALWSLGGRLEPLCGPRTLIGTYAAANLVAGAVYFAIARSVPLLALTPLDYPAGALAAYCLTVWQRFRYEQVLVLGRPMSLGKTYLVCAALVAGLALLGAREGAVAWVLAALAGAVGSRVLGHVPTWLRGMARTRRARPRSAKGCSSISSPISPQAP